MEKVKKFIDKENIGEYKENASFKTLTTYKIGGNIKLLVYPKSIEGLSKLIIYLKKQKIKYYIVGNGSNILASDNDFKGVIIKTNRIDYVKKINNRYIVGAGCNLIKLANEICGKGLSGLEFACGIPGTVGGAVYMNAGAYNASISHVFIEGKFLNEKGELITLTNRDMDFSYRHSMLQENKHLINVEATFGFKAGNKEDIMSLVATRRDRRLESQPLSYPSAGSVFRNPYGLYAGKLIEDAGLKGKCVGGAKISNKHANFIINHDHATANDVKELMDMAKNQVAQQFGINLVMEQELLNWE